MSYVTPRYSTEDLEEGCWGTPTKQVGEVKHFYSKRGVAAVELTNDLKEGDMIALRNHNHVIGVSSLQMNHKPIKKGRAGSVVGVKLPMGMKAKNHDKVYMERPQLIGHVTTYFSKKKVASVKLIEPLTIGDVIIFRKGNDFYKHVVQQMQIDHCNVTWAEPGSSEVGIKVPGRIKRKSKVFVLERGINVQTIRGRALTADGIKPILVGKVTNAYKNINVLGIKLNSGLLAVGDIIAFKKGRRTFKLMISSMQINHQNVEVAYPGEDGVAVKVPCCSSSHSGDPLSKNAAVFVVYGAANAHAYSKW